MKKFLYTIAIRLLSFLVAKEIYLFINDSAGRLNDILIVLDSNEETGMDK
jgi:hypothetical protein